MNLALWITAAVLAAGFLGSGAMKLVTPKDKLVTMSFGKWSEGFSPGVVIFIGLMEVAAAAGLILPAVTGVAPVLVPAAALGLVLLMTGAMVLHLRRRETQAAVMAVGFVVVAGFVAWGRFVVAPLST